MERLTERVGEDFQCNDHSCWLSYCDRECDHYKRMINKLADYEDAEEKGLLLQLPCKIGDTIFKIPSKVNYDLNIINGHEKINRIYEQKVHSIQMWSNDRYLMTTCDGLCSVLSDFYKETWFLTYEEAEQALKQMGE